MGIIYMNNGKILAYGNITENITHYIIDTTYYDKQGLQIAEIALPNDFSLNRYTFDGINLKRTKESFIINKDEFVKRINNEELSKIADYENEVENLIIVPAEKTQLKNILKAWLLKLNLFTQIDLSDADVINMGNIFVKYGFITENRMREILS